MEQIVTLHLNEIGRKAFKADTKEITMNILDGPITAETINDKFPMELVESFDTKPSFLNLSVDTHVAVVDTDGKHYLGQVRQSYDKRYVSVEILGNVKFGLYDFNANGIQSTHSKNKLHLEFISNEEIEQMKLSIRNMPFINLMLMLAEGGGVEVDQINAKAPEWLTFETIEKIQKILEDEIHYYDENC